MGNYITIMSQLQNLTPRYQIENLTNQYLGNRYVKSFTCWNQYTVMLYAQASGKDSLRDIQNSLATHEHKFYHLGLKSVRRSTLCDANNKRDYRIYESLFYETVKRCKDITPKHRFKFKNPLLLMDSTTIDLCLSMFDWAKFRTTKGAIKMHCLFDLSGQIPVFAYITDGKKGDITVARLVLDIVPDSIYCWDRGYIDFEFLYKVESKGAFFVTRAKDNLNYTVTGQHGSYQKNGVLSDEIITLNGFYQQKDYPKTLRLIRYYDHETDKELVFMTNNFKLAAYTITQIYKARWYIEVFFKWIKQNLKIKTFFGTSRNAVLSQIWIAMIYFVLLAYIKYQSKYKYSLFYLHKIIKETLMERFHLLDLLNLDDNRLKRLKSSDSQPELALAFT